MPIFDKNKETCFCIGKIVKTHGLHGMVAIKLDDSDLLDFSQLEFVYIQINNRLIPYFIESSNERSTKATVKFYDIETVDAAEILTRNKIFVEKEWLEELEEDDFYYHEIVGFEVIDTEDGLIGTVESVVENPAHDLLEVRTDSGLVLIPIVDHIVGETDRENKTIHVTVPEGLLDL